MLRLSFWKIITIGIICLASAIFALPSLINNEKFASLPLIPQKKINLGLDLQGGSHLLLQVDINSYINEQLEFLLDDIRNKLRENQLGYLNLAKKDQIIKFTLRDLKDKEKVKEILKKISRTSTIDISDAGEVSFAYSEQELTSMKKNVVEQSIEIVRRRVDEIGTKEPIIQRQGDTRILLQVPGLNNPEQLKKILGRTAKMTFHLLADENSYNKKEKPELPGTIWVKERNRSGIEKYYLARKKIELSGESLVFAQATYDDAGMPAVSFRFNNQGGKKFADITSSNLGKRFAIILDNEVITAPVIKTAILNGSGIIQGNFVIEEANDLALLLRAGALPAPLSVAEERTIGPSLGEDSVNAGKLASVTAIFLVMFIMAGYYRLFGIFANTALIINLFIIIAVMVFMGSTLTLPGIAGIALTMGIAVDANVLIFERIREESRSGKTPIAAIDHGFKRAFGTILDSNITTLIATIILFIYGTGPVKGFAVTLTIGVISSMFTAISLTKLMIIIWMRKTRPEKLESYI